MRTPTLRIPTLRFPRSAATSRLRRVATTAYLGASIGSVLAAAAGRRGDHATWVIKPTLMPLLWATLPRRTPALTLALAAATLGDVILMLPASRSTLTERSSLLNAGSSAFALTQLSYITQLRARLARTRGTTTPDRSALALHAPAILAGTGLAALRAPAALPAALGYGACLATVSSYALSQPGVTPARLVDDLRSLADAAPATTTFRLGPASVCGLPADSAVALGALTFITSDSLILGRLSLLREGSRLDGLADGAVMATYVLAQWLIAHGLCALADDSPR